MAMTIVDARVVCGGVDTHADFHVAAALDHLGGVLGIESFETTEAGYRRLLGWLESFGTLTRVGVEGTGSYGTGLAGSCMITISKWWRWIAPTGSCGTAAASRIRPMRSPQLVPRFRVKHRDDPSGATAQWNRCGCCWWRAARHVINESKP